MPLEAIIGQLLAPYHPSGRQGNNQQTTIKQYTHFADHFDGHCNAAVQYRMHWLIEEVQGFTKSHWMPPLSKHSLG